MNNDKPLCIKLRELREQNGYSQADLAEHLHVSRQAISNWENGKTCPDIDNLAMLCKLYGTSLDQLYSINTTADNIVETTSVSQEESAPNQNTIVEMLCIALILALTHQIAFLNVIAPIAVMVFLRCTKRKYSVIYVLSIICLLLALYDTYTVIYHLFYDFGFSTIEPV